MVSYGSMFEVMSKFNLLLITIFIMIYLFLAYFISYQKPHEFYELMKGISMYYLLNAS